MKLIIFISIEVVAATIMLLYRDCVIDTPYLPLRPAWLAFGAAMGALAGMYKAQINQWLNTNDQLNDERNMMEVYKFRVDEKDKIISAKDIAIEKLQKYAEEDKKTIENLNYILENRRKILRDRNEIIKQDEKTIEDMKFKVGKYDGVIATAARLNGEVNQAQEELSESRKQSERVILDVMKLRWIINDHNMIAFVAAYQNNGAIMSQNALADKLGWTRAKVRRMAEKINKLVGYEFIKWGEAKVKVAAKRKEVKPFVLGTEFEGVKIPKNWMENFDLFKEAVAKKATACGCYKSELAMDCGFWRCCECICDQDNNAAARRLIAKVEAMNKSNKK